MPPVVWTAVAFALGIGVAPLLPGVPPWAWPAGALGVLAGGVWCFGRGKRETPLWLLLCFCLLGGTWGALGSSSFPPSLRPLLGHYVRVQGTLEGLPVAYPNRLVYTLADPVLELGGETWQGHLRLQVVLYNPSPGQPQASATPSRLPRVYPGDRLQVEGRLDLPPLPLNPGEFNYRSYLERQGIPAVLTADRPPAVYGQQPGFRYRLLRLLASARLRVENGIDRAVPPEQAVLIKGFLLGSTRAITPEDRELYQRTGVMHLFAVSGLNLGFVLLLLAGLAGLLRLQRAASLALVTAGLWGYAAITGFPASVLRAAVMGTVGWGAYLWQQRQNPLGSLALAALVILVADPGSLRDPGFQLSFAATWGIIYLAPPLGSLFPCWEGHPLLKACRELFTVTLAAQLAVLPLCALYFQQLPLLSLLANLLVIPLAGVVVYLVLVGMLLSLLYPGLAVPLYIPAGALGLAIKGLLRLFAHLPGGSLMVPVTPLWLVAAWFLALGVLGWSLRGGGTVSFPHFRFRPWNRRWLLPAVLGLALLLVLMPSGGGLGSLAGGHRLRVTFISVGQGDSILVEFPGGRSMLVDAGGKEEFSSSSFEPGRQIVVPYLTRSGLSRLDLVVNTHSHADHLGGIPAVLERLLVGGLVLPPEPAPTPLSLRVERIARERGIPVTRVKAGATLNLDPQVGVRVLSPPDTGPGEDLNDTSLVLLIKYGEVSFLLTGDAGGGVLDGLAAAPLPESRVSVLKLPHHGSRTGLCPALADRLHPRFAVISVGRNPFGHPEPSVVDFWQQRGARVLRTDREGAVIFETDGSRLLLKTLRQSPKEMPMERAA